MKSTTRRLSRFTAMIPADISESGIVNFRILNRILGRIHGHVPATYRRTEIRTYMGVEMNEIAFTKVRMLRRSFLRGLARLSTSAPA